MSARARLLRAHDLHWKYKDAASLAGLVREQILRSGVENCVLWSQTMRLPRVGGHHRRGFPITWLKCLLTAPDLMLKRWSLAAVG
jgi:hypothetical protein